MSLYPSWQELTEWIASLSEDEWFLARERVMARLPSQYLAAYQNQFQQALPPHLYQQALGMQAARIPYETRLAARQRYEEWEIGIQQQVRQFPGGGEEYWDHRYLEANHRSQALLHRHLTEDQKKQLQRWGWFEVVSKTRSRWGRWQYHQFRIHEHCMVYEHTRGGRRHYCIMAMEPGMPEADWMLMVKMLIEGDLRKFYSIAKLRGWQPVG